MYLGLIKESVVKKNEWYMLKYYKFLVKKKKKKGDGQNWSKPDASHLNDDHDFHTKILRGKWISYTCDEEDAGFLQLGWL